MLFSSVNKDKKSYLSDVMTGVCSLSDTVVVFLCTIEFQKYNHKFCIEYNWRIDCIYWPIVDVMFLWEALCLSSLKHIFYEVVVLH